MILFYLEKKVTKMRSLHGVHFVEILVAGRHSWVMGRVKP